MDRYTGLSPTVSRIFLMIPSVPIQRGAARQNRRKKIKVYQHVYMDMGRESARIGYAFRVERRETDKRTDCINFPGFDSLETRCIVILVICWARECRPNSAVL